MRGDQIEVGLGRDEVTKSEDLRRDYERARERGLEQQSSPLRRREQFHEFARNLFTDRYFAIFSFR